MKLPRFKQPVMTGIDIQPEGIHLVQLNKRNNLFSLEKISFLALPPTMIAEGKVINWDKLAAILFDWVQELNITGAITAAALSAQQVHLTQMAIQTEVQEPVVRAYLEQTFPGLSTELVMDYCEIPGSDPKKAMLAAAKKDYLEHYAACLRDAGLNVKVMDIDIYAIQRAMQNEVTALLWQQHHRFVLICQQNKQPFLQSQWQAVSGEQAVAELVQRLAQHNITQLQFCGSSYYVDLFKQATSLSAIKIHYFLPPFICSERNLPDYLLAIGLAMREVPLW